MSEYAAQRLNMVEGQVRANDVTDRRIQIAMSEIARERFVPERLHPVAYMDRCLEILPGRYILDPRSFSKLVQVAAVEQGDRVLDVGCGSGYSSAVLCRLADEVVALEADPELAAVARQFLSKNANVTIVTGPLPEGAPDKAPFDVIFINGAIEIYPERLLRQLADGGRLVAIVSERGRGQARLYLNANGAIGERNAFDAQVPVLPGFERARVFEF